MAGTINGNMIIKYIATPDTANNIPSRIVVGKCLIAKKKEVLKSCFTPILNLERTGKRYIVAKAKNKAVVL